MSVESIVQSLGPPRGSDGRLQIDMSTVLELHAKGYSPRQIGKALGVSKDTIRVRLGERLPPRPKNEAMAERARKGHRAWKRAMARRRKEMEAEAKRARDKENMDGMIKLGLLAIVADHLPLVKKEGGEPGAPPPPGWVQ